MYYEERLINGVTYFRHTPNGKWIEKVINNDMKNAKHYYFDEEIEVTVKVKVKKVGISNYQQLSEKEQEIAMNDFKVEIADHLQNKLVGSYGQQEVTEYIDWFSFDVETD